MSSPKKTLKSISSSHKTPQKATPSFFAKPELALRNSAEFCWRFLKSNWKGLAVIFVATAIFFWPLIIHISNYSEGGDAMFNAWTLARDQHCILRQGCPVYSNANIYFPHKDTMLYSETQLSAGALTLPLYFINKNPIFSYNVMTIVSFLLAGWFMYLLAKRLSKRNELFSIMAALVFEFAPFKMAAVSHLQNLSIFYLPLVVLLILKYMDDRRKRWLALLFVALVLQFYASWYQMVFVLITLGVFLLCALLLKVAKPKIILIIGATILLSVITTLPLAKQYVRFSKANDATFKIDDQATYSSSLADYVIPNNGTLLGKAYYKLRPGAKVNSFNPDSYSYHGMILYVVALGLLIFGFPWRNRKRLLEEREYKLLLTFVVIGITGFFISLGPLLKIKGNTTYNGLADGLKVVIPLPYIIVDKLLPQLSFIRAIGRASVLTLFALCASLTLLPVVLKNSSLSKTWRLAVSGIVCLLIVVELLPVHRFGLTGNAYNYNLNIPKVYNFIKSNNDINNIVILNGDKDYPNAPIPVARAEWVLWAGYDNKNIFNGYSGYTPPEYFSQYDDFVDFKPDDVAKMEALQIKYVLVDKQLSSSTPNLVNDVSSVLPTKVYEDQRYVLFKI